MTIALAQHRVAGRGPTLLFLPGYASDMGGTKALAIEAWARDRGRASVRFDYRGCGASPGDFAGATLADWRDDVLGVLDSIEGPVVLIGSSMGGWLMLLAARARPERIHALIGVAAAPDFTDWGFSIEEKLEILNRGRIERANPYGPAPSLYTRGLWQSGEALRLMHGPIAIDAPVRLIHGMRDADVPYNRAIRLAELITSRDVRTILIRDGDHRLSTPADLACLTGVIEECVA